VQQIYLGINYFCIALGIIIISYYGILPTDYKENINILDDIPLFYGLIQFIPLILLELVCFKQLKMMRELNKTANRKADLTPRHITDYIANKYIILAVIIYISYIVSEAILNNFAISSDFMIKAGTVTLVNILFIFLALANVYGKKRDPFLTDSDRFKQTKFAIQTLIFISIFMTIYLMAHSLVNTYNYNYVEIVLNSLYFQVIALYTLSALLGRFKIDEINFEVYKADNKTA